MPTKTLKDMTIHIDFKSNPFIKLINNYRPCPVQTIPDSNGLKGSTSLAAVTNAVTPAAALP